MPGQQPTGNIPNEKEEKLIAKVNSVEKALPSLVKRVATGLSQVVECITKSLTAESKAQSIRDNREKQALQQQASNVQQDPTIKSSTNKSAGGGAGH